MKKISANAISAEEIKFIRNKFNLTQKDFATIANVSIKTVQGWERTEKLINGPVVPLIQLLMQSENSIDKLTAQEKKFGMRLWYKFKNITCTLIEVDELGRRVEIINYVDNLMYRAFGNIQQPTYDEYEEFIKSRCFPETRDKIKLILKDLELPFYDPIMIIEKTQGRMAEDNFWIEIEG